MLTASAAGAAAQRGGAGTKEVAIGASQQRAPGRSTVGDAGAGGRVGCAHLFLSASGHRQRAVAVIIVADDLGGILQHGRVSRYGSILSRLRRPKPIVF